MKKNFLALTLPFLSTQLFSATSVDLQLRGSVPIVVSISVTAETIATSLPLNVTQSNTRVARVTEKTNGTNGYRVIVESVNKGKLVRAGGSEQFSYGLQYNGVVLNLTNPAPILYSSSLRGEQVRDVHISYTGVPTEAMIVGDYMDTVTFSIAPN